jgi:hypothetical protein
MNMALSYIIPLFGLAIACIGIAYQYSIEHRKPPRTRHLPGPWGKAQSNWIMLDTLC